ncbi:RNA ligase 1-like [Saccostrea echinata]|uniref:RNA ligase 1-like n=1 Tax=Saccostrea echinata TaxID=191078 RepID=UPI002A7EF00F|nr:RNA ligase 1-like [Saccostrea echinata]
MEKCGKVQQKVSCIFETHVIDEPASKRKFQGYKVIATDVIKSAAIASSITESTATEKLDGTCVYIAEWQGLPWLWARLDRKPNKAGDKRFKQFQFLHQKWEQGPKDIPEPTFEWNIEKDFKEVPDHWRPASDVNLVNGQPQPDKSRHIPGWVPLEKKSRQYCWHESAVDLDRGLGLFLMQKEGCPQCLQIQALPLRSALGHTAELIGTHINGNAYSIGSKRNPLHFLVIHGSIPLSDPPEISLTEIQNWFSSTQEGLVEGVVWHCQNGKLFKIHRHHLNLPWPLKDTTPIFSQRRVEILVDSSNFESDENVNTAFQKLSRIFNKKCDSILDLDQLLDSDGEK